jgi:hypothetical protein
MEQTATVHEFCAEAVRTDAKCGDCHALKGLYVLRLEGAWALRCYPCYRDNVPRDAKPPNAVSFEVYPTTLVKRWQREQIALRPTAPGRHRA